MDRPIWQWSAGRTAQAIRERELGCVTVMEAHVARLRETHGALNAVTVDLGDAALAEAARADRALEAGTVRPGPLYGVPVTIKENIDVRGQATPNGVSGLAGNIAPDDSPVVGNLRRAGAIVLGRTNTPEFSFRAFTANPLRGATVNPWGARATCGGSSGGAAASVAAGVGGIAHGNDIGGSLRYPADRCGVATVRPTLGRVPAFNPSQPEERALLMQMMSVQGPIARTVEDVRLGLAVMAEGDPRDPLWVPAPLEGPRLARPLRVAVAAQGVGLHPAVGGALDRAAAILDEAGYAVEACEPPDIRRVLETWTNLIFTDFRVTMTPVVRKLGSPDVNAVVDGYLAMSVELDLEGYVRGLAERQALLREWLQFLDRYPIVLTPVSTEPPYPPDEDLKGADRVREIFESFAYMSGLNLLGLPVAVAPVSVHDGIPVGIQIVGQRYREDVCLDAAAVIENSVGVLCEQLWAREGGLSAS